MSTADNIRLRREQLGISVAELAQKLGVAKTTIYRYEKGEIENVNSEKLIPLAEALKTTPAALMGWSPNSNEQQVIQRTPDLEKAALKATEILRDFDVKAGPVLPMPILQATSGVFVVSFTEMATDTGIDSINLEMEFGAQNQDVVIVPEEINGERRYFVAYNQRLPFYMLQFALARELGHIILGHDETTPEDVGLTESLYFARYLLCPRPLIAALKRKGAILTVETVGNITGCYGRCLAGIRKTPGAHIPAGLNREISDKFTKYADKIIEYQHILPFSKSPIAEFGTYMDNYID